MIVSGQSAPTVVLPSAFENFARQANASIVLDTDLETLVSDVARIRFHATRITDGMRTTEGVEVALSSGSLKDAAYLEKRFFREFQSALQLMELEPELKAPAIAREVRFPNVMEKEVPGGVINVINVGLYRKGSERGVYLVFPGTGHFYFPGVELKSIRTLFSAPRLRCARDMPGTHQS